MLKGLNHETALGRIIGIRAEKNSEVIKSMGAYEKKIRSEWNTFKYKRMTKKEKENNLEKATNILQSFFG